MRKAAARCLSLSLCLISALVLILLYLALFPSLQQLPSSCSHCCHKLVLSDGYTSKCCHSMPANVRGNLERAKKVLVHVADPAWGELLLWYDQTARCHLDTCVSSTSLYIRGPLDLTRSGPPPIPTTERAPVWWRSYTAFELESGSSDVQPCVIRTPS